MRIGPAKPPADTRAMLVFAAALLGVAMSGLVAAVAPRPQPTAAPAHVNYVTPTPPSHVETPHAS